MERGQEHGKAELRVADELRLFLRQRYRRGPVLVTCDGVSSLGHVVQSAGIPLTEVGALSVGGTVVAPARRPVDGDLVSVKAISRPQRLARPSFLLDVHLGTLARRLRLLDIDAAYPGGVDDAALVDQANAEHRVLLTKDRGLLCRRRLEAGAYVRGAKPDDQLADVLGRFAPPLAPWTRCVACDGRLVPVSKASAEPDLLAGTRRSYETFARCADCGKLYWRGAHAARLQAIVDVAKRHTP